MALIENKKIYDHSKSEIAKLTKDLDDLIISEKELIKTNKALSDSLQSVKKTSDGKEAKELVETTEKLTKSTNELTEAQKNEIKIQKQLEKAQQDLINSESAEAIELEKLKLKKAEQIKLNKDVAKELNTLEKGYQKEIKTLNSLRESNKKLTKERNNLNLETQEGITRLKQINDQLDENNEAIKENVDGYTQQKIGIGGYKEGIEQALPGMTNMVTGFKQMTLAALKFIATPIGAVITAIVLVFKLLQGAFSRSLSSQEKLNKITGKLSAAFNLVLDALIPVVEFILDQVLIVFENMGKAVVFVIDQLEKWGIISEKTSKKVKKSLDSNTKAVDDLASAERRLVEADIALQKSQLKFQTLAEAQRQIRDDESKSIEERIAANEELGRLLTEQAATETIHAQAVLKIAKQRQQVNGESVESIREIGEAEVKLLEITERVEAQRSEQIVNTNSLLKEQQEKIIAVTQAELDRFNKAEEIREAEEEAALETEERLLAEDEAITKSAENFNAAEQIKQDAISKTKDEADELAKKLAENAMLIVSASIQAGSAMGELMAQGLLTFKEFSKILLKTTLDVVQRQINIWLVGLLPRLVLSLGPIGGPIALAAITIAVNAGLATAKAGIANFNEGTEYVPGTGNKDTVAAMLTPGERVVPAEINKRLEGISNSDLPGLLTKQDNNMLVAGLLMKGNQNSSDMIELLGRLGLVYKMDGQQIIERAGSGREINLG